MTYDNAMAAYWAGYEAAITCTSKPKCERYQFDLEKGWADGKNDLANQLVHTGAGTYLMEM